MNSIAQQIEETYKKKDTQTPEQGHYAGTSAYRIADSALEIAKAILSSPRHTTLNEGFAKQCVEFVKAVEREAGFGVD